LPSNGYTLYYKRTPADGVVLLVNHSTKSFEWEMKYQPTTLFHTGSPLDNIDPPQAKLDFY